MKDTQTTALLLTGFLGLLCFVGPALDVEDHGYEHEVAREELDKQRRQERFENAAREVCGPNAAWRLTHKQGEVICLVRHSNKSRVEKL